MDIGGSAFFKLKIMVLLGVKKHQQLNWELIGVSAF